MSQEQRHGRVMQPTGGITFNGVPLPPLTPVENDGDVDARSGKRKAMDWYEGLVSNNVAVYGAGGAGSSTGVRRGGGGGGGGEQQQRQVSTMFATRERERRRRLNDTFTAMRRLLPNLPDKSNRVEVVDGAIAYIKMLKDAEAEMEAQHKQLQAAAAAASSSSSSSSAVTVAAYDPDFGVAAPPAPAKARGAMAPTPRPVGPTPPPPPFAVPVAQLGATSRWQFATAVAPEMPPPAPVPRASRAAAVPVASLKTWSWGANVVISMMGNIGNMSVRAPVRSGALNSVHTVLQKYTITVLTSVTATDPSQTHNLFMLYTNIDMPNRVPQFVNLKVYEAMYRAAGAEIAGFLTADESERNARGRY